MVNIWLIYVIPTLFLVYGIINQWNTMLYPHFCWFNHHLWMIFPAIRVLTASQVGFPTFQCWSPPAGPASLVRWHATSGCVTRAKFLLMRFASWWARTTYLLSGRCLSSESWDADGFAMTCSKLHRSPLAQ